MTAPWPSERPRTGPASKAPTGHLVPTDWASGWAVMVLWIIVLTVAGTVIGTVAVPALDALQHLTDALSSTTRNVLL